ncbi:ABC transporter substrate-binding protein [Natranaerobius thermophilus]|uniref:Extracellular solute-binding protein family 5 n=1 Tax=Natranaerobius thermophilus (strain ATCC BAA-1301 / DSM 18059 / JW/NM-WN-LF) TaxID=457570 RepID=B2A7Z5_NATTJ|nr:ABC transporter substrate-binding protein [Natranaerobius thermophilus]ACB85767.1 extracellular solute-binding protein family 5 [Natranaerobius thermophilus JW/NM-WN-LF]
MENAGQFFKKFSVLMAVLIVTTALVIGCGDGGDPDASDDLDPDRKVPEVRFVSSTADDNQIRNEAVQLVADWWEEIGLEVDIQTREFNSLVNRVLAAPEDKDFEAYILGWSGRVSRSDPDMFLYSLYHSNQAVDGGNNSSVFKNEKYDELVSKQRAEMDLEKRQELVFEAQEVLAEEVPDITLYYRDEIQGYNNERWEDLPSMAGEGIFNEQFPYEATPKTDDAEFVIANSANLDTFNPFAAETVYEWKFLRLVYDKLVRLDENFEPQPWAAEEINVVEGEDGEVIDVTLRDDLQFHDGEPLGPEDVVFTFDYMFEEGIPYFQAFLDPIETVDLMDDDETIRFTLEEAYAPFITNTLGQIPILPEHIWADVMEEENLDHPSQFDNAEAIGSGPFKFDNWERGEYIRIVKNDDYFKADDIDVEAIRYDKYSHSEGVFGALENQQADVNENTFDPEYVQQAEDLDHLTVVREPDIGFDFIGLNNYKEPFNDKAVRQAAAHAIDLDELVDVLLYGYGDPAGAGQTISTGNEMWKNDDVKEYPFDIDKAREILKDAGYEWDSDGRLYFPEE